MPESEKVRTLLPKTAAEVEAEAKTRDPYAGSTSGSVPKIGYWRRAILRVLAFTEIRRDELRLFLDNDPFLQRFTTSATHFQPEQKEKFKFRHVFTSKFWRDLVIDPSNTFYYKWSQLVAIAIYYNIIVVIVRAVFPELQKTHLMPFWFVMDYFFDTVYILDGFVKSRLGYLEHGILVTDPKILSQKYIFSPRYFVDVLCVVPLELFYIFVGYTSLLRTNRILKVFRLKEFIIDSETRLSYPILFRLVFLIFNILIVIHWNACIFYAFSERFGLNTDDWVYSVTKEADLHFANKYLRCFYWSMLTLTAIGDNPTPERVEAFLYTICCTLIGVLIFATIFGNIGVMVNQMNASRTEFQKNVDSVKRYMAVRRVCPFLQDRVVRWFAYRWKNEKQAVDDEQALSILPEKLRAEISIHVHLDTLKRVALFKDCEPGLLIELVLKLRLQVISPGDYVCRYGDIGKEMYIVKRGKLIVIGDDGKTILSMLEDGEVFGEISILNIPGNRTGNRRTCSVRSVGYSDLFCLSKFDLWQALAEYPDAKKMLQERGKQILRKDHLLDEEAAVKEEVSKLTLEKKVEYVSYQVTGLSDKIDLMFETLALIQHVVAPDAKVPKRVQSTESVGGGIMRNFAFATSLLKGRPTEYKEKSEDVLQQHSKTQEMYDKHEKSDSHHKHEKSDSHHKHEKSDSHHKHEKSETLHKSDKSDTQLKQEKSDTSDKHKTSDISLKVKGWHSTHKSEKGSTSDVSKKTDAMDKPETSDKTGK